MGAVAITPRVAKISGKHISFAGWARGVKGHFGANYGGG
jgi:hypothetical protein